MVHSQSEHRACLRYGKPSFDVCMRLLFHILAIPPEEFGMEMTLVENWVHPVEEGVARYLHGVSEKRNIHVGMAVDLQLSGIFTYKPGLQRGIVVNEAALRLAELAAHTDGMLIEGGVVAE